MEENLSEKLNRLSRMGLSLFAVLLMVACSSSGKPQTAAKSPAPSEAAPVSQPATSTPGATSKPTITKTSQATPTVQSLTPTGTFVPTPDCASPVSLTPAMTEGPYYKSGSPERASLIEPGMKGTRLFLSGFVLTSDCKPVDHAWLDFWQANAQGQYDNNGYTLRGHEFTTSNGYYSLETIVPGLYPGRTEHIHVKIQAPGGPVLTSQLFFPGVAQNQSDAIYSDQLLLSVQETPEGLQATFNFVVNTQP
jgi:protocatechuate 3,4-dioxygenase beta subunit